MCDARCLPSASPRCAKILHRLRAALGARGGGVPAGGGAGGNGGLGDIQGLGCVPGAALGGRFSGFGSWAGLCELRTASLPSLLPAPGADRCSRAATQDKAVKRYVVRNIVDAASLRDITEACAIEGAPPRIQPLPSKRMLRSENVGSRGRAGAVRRGARGSASSPLRPLPAHEHRLTFPPAVDLRLRAAEALPQDVLLHLCGDPLALRARAIAHQPPHPRPAATLCPETGGQAKARCHVKLNLDKTHKKEKLESGR